MGGYSYVKEDRRSGKFEAEDNGSCLEEHESRFCVALLYRECVAPTSVRGPVRSGWVHFGAQGCGPLGERCSVPGAWSLPGGMCCSIEE